MVRQAARVYLFAACEPRIASSWTHHLKGLRISLTGQPYNKCGRDVPRKHPSRRALPGASSGALRLEPWFGGEKKKDQKSQKPLIHRHNFAACES
jgi:hypothetical protein